MVELLYACQYHAMKLLHPASISQASRHDPFYISIIALVPERPNPGQRRSMIQMISARYP
jgi:hypothetical protein